MKSVTVASIALTFVIGLFYMPAYGYQSHDQAAKKITPASAANMRELAERERDYQLAPIKSSSDLAKYIAKNDPNSPLRRLSRGAQSRFIKSLVITDRGLASFYYDDLVKELTATQVHQVLSLFGAQRSTTSLPGLRITSPADAAIKEAAFTCQHASTEGCPGEDYPRFACVNRATCQQMERSICIGANC